MQINETLQRRRVELAALVMVFGSAMFLRLFALDAFPPGIQHDEIFISNFAQTILQGQFPIFFEMNRGNYPLFIYLVALSHQLFGVNAWSLRLVAALSGILGIFISYALARAWLNRFAAMMVAVGLTFSFWLLFESRTGLHAVTTFLFAALTFAVFWRGWWNEKPGWLLASGVLAGISMYTYLAGNFIPIALALFVGYSLIFHRAKWKRYYWMVPAIFSIAAVVYAPLGYFLYTHRDTALARVGDLTDVIELVLKGNLAPLLTNILRTLGMFGFTGDPEWRYNVANLPVFDPLWAVLFYLGVAIAVWRFKQPAYAFALIWLITLIAPTMFSPSNPSQLRSTGAIGVVYMFPAIALVTIGNYVFRFTEHASRITPRVFHITYSIFILALILLAAFTGIWNFFYVWTAHPEVRTIYRADLANAAHWLDVNAKNEPILISAEFANDLDRAAFGLESKRDLRPHFFVGTDTFVIPASNSALYVNPQSGAISDDMRQRFFVSLVPIRSFALPGAKSNELEIYRVDANTLNAWRAPFLKQAVDTTTNAEVELLGVEIPASGASADKARVRLWWRVLNRQHSDDDGMLWTIRLMDSHGYVWTETNGLGYTPSQWQPGDVVASTFDVEIPADALPQSYTIQASFGDKKSLLTFQLHGNAILLGAIKITRGAISKPSSPVPFPSKQKFGDALQLLGTDAIGEVAAGDAWRVALFWKTDAPIPNDYKVRLRAMSEDGKHIIVTQDDVIAPEYPTHNWRAGEYVRSLHDFKIPDDAPRGKVVVRLYVFDANANIVGRTDGAPIAGIEITGRSHTFAAPNPRQKLNVRFGDSIELVGYDTTTPRANQPMTVTLYWHALAPTDKPYTVFVHLLDANNQILGQKDAPPMNGDAQTNSWVQGEYITDTYSFNVVANASGAAQIEIGLYDPGTFARLKVFESAKSVEDRLLIQGLMLEK